MPQREAFPVRLSRRPVQPHAMLLSCLPVPLVGGVVSPGEDPQAILLPLVELPIIPVTCLHMRCTPM